MAETKPVHLEMIQGVINRLSHNSFLLKGWTIALVSAMFALAVRDTSPQFVYLAYFPAISFWGLDAYFLRQERLFRALYDKVRLLSESEVDFSMDTTQVEDGVDSWSKVFSSKTLSAFHGVVFASILAVMFLALAKRT